MSSINVNRTNFKYPRLKMEDFSFSDNEEKLIINSLNKLESIFSEGAQIIFSISKQDDLFSGSLKIESLNIYSHGKCSSAMKLFFKLRESLESKKLIR